MNLIFAWEFKFHIFKDCSSTGDASGSNAQVAKGCDRETIPEVTLKVEPTEEDDTVFALAGVYAHEGSSEGSGKTLV